MTSVGFITGGNRGIGLALVRALATRWGDEGRVILTARSEARGREAVAALGDEDLTVDFLTLDIADPESIAAFADALASQHGGVDVVVQNAAFAPPPGPSTVEDTRRKIETTNFGTYRLIEATRSLWRPGARVLVVASGFAPWLASMNGCATAFRTTLRRRS